tara:strand:- start:219 stop:797 length:579 start_codon:yes stop_codon:yes gene_type:complete
MKTFNIDQGTDFGTWEDTTSKLLYDDAMPAMLNGVNTEGKVLDYGGANGLLKKYIPNSLSIDIDPTKKPDIVEDIKTYKPDCDLVVMRYLLHYLKDKEVTNLFTHLFCSNVKRILVIQFVNKNLADKKYNSINETKFFRTEKNLCNLFTYWKIKQIKKLSYVVEKEFYLNRLKHPNPKTHEETLLSIELQKL